MASRSSSALRGFVNKQILSSNIEKSAVNELSTAGKFIILLLYIRITTTDIQVFRSTNPKRQENFIPDEATNLWT